MRTAPLTRVNAISRALVHTRLTIVTCGILALMAPTGLHAQRRGGPFEMVGRAGVGALTSPQLSITPRGSTVDSELVPRDTTSHHGSRAHHAAVGALVGAVVGTGFGIAADRPWLGVGESRHGHFNNLWVVTAPLGALIGALVGAAWPAD